MQTRRVFLRSAAATASSLAARQGTIPYRKLGRTGEKVSLVGLGGFHIGTQTDPQESMRIIRTAIDGGVNFMDNCWDYNGGQSEIRMGQALRDGYRDKVFLMTKIDGRTKASAMAQLEQSLKRLETDRVDLLQIHEVIRTGDPARVFAPGGCIEALQQARKAGKVRYLGFTGHKDPSIHLHMLETGFAHGFTPDAVQMPLNVLDAHFRSFERAILPVLQKHGIAALGMKPLASKDVLAIGTVTPAEALHYAMNLPVATVITGCDSMAVLRQAMEAAATFQPMSAAEVSALLGRTAAAGRYGAHELFKTSDRFDATSRHPDWLG